MKVVVEKMTRNRRKVIGKPEDSLLCRLHSVQLSALVYSFLYGFNLFSSFNKIGMYIIVFVSFSGLSLVQVKSPDAIGVSKSTTLNCWYYLNNPGELIYSVSWYWTPPIRKSSDLDFRCWDKSRLMSRPEFPTKTVHFFRYRKIDPDGERKKAWNHQLRGIFDVNVGFF